ncbi:hypothetical protein LINPERHAP1_LOCUS25538, partial [Linum perenne]
MVDSGMIEAGADSGHEESTKRLRPNNPSCPRQIRQKEKTASIASLYAQSSEVPNIRREC